MFTYNFPAHKIMDCTFRLVFCLPSANTDQSQVRKYFQKFWFPKEKLLLSKYGPVLAFVSLIRSFT
jgi:hypothetical protein